jgi:hypothetical protein
MAAKEESQNVEAASSPETSVTNYHQHDVISQKTLIFITSALKSSNHLLEFVGKFQCFFAHLNGDLVNIYHRECLSRTSEKKDMVHGQYTLYPLNQLVFEVTNINTRNVLMT